MSCHFHFSQPRNSNFELKGGMHCLKGRVISFDLQSYHLVDCPMSTFLQKNIRSKTNIAAVKTKNPVGCYLECTLYKDNAHAQLIKPLIKPHNRNMKKRPLPNNNRVTPFRLQIKRVQIARFQVGWLFILTCGSYSSVFVATLSLEDIFQELESKLDNKINQLIADKTVPT